MSSVFAIGAFVPFSSFKVSEAGHRLQLSPEETTSGKQKQPKGLTVVNIGEVLASFRVLGGALVENIIVDTSSFGRRIPNDLLY